MSKFTLEDVQFLESQNDTGRVESNIYLTAQHGYIRNLQRPQLVQLENIYKRVINPKYTLCYHCSTDILNLVLELYRVFEADKDKPSAITPEPIAEPGLDWKSEAEFAPSETAAFEGKKKPGRPKKNQD